MNLRKIALGLLFGGALAAGSVACDDSSSSSSTSTTGTGDGGIPQPCATIGSDTDTATTPWVTITHLALPSADGFNLDGINNAPAGGSGGGSGATIGGCGKTDISGGKDNSLASIAASLMTVVDLNAALQEALAPVGTLLLEARMTHLSAADVATDACIGAEIRVTSPDPAMPGMNIVDTFAGSGSMTNHVASVSFGSELLFNISVNTPSSACINNMCTPGDLAIAIRSPVGRVTLNAANSAIQAGSLIGGFIFYVDNTDAAYASANATGFEAALAEFASDVNLGSSFAAQATSAFSNARDLHMDPSGTLTPCTSPTNSTSNTNRNAVSVAITVDTL